MSRFSAIFSILLWPLWLWAHEGPRTKPSHKAHYFIENKGQWESNILFKAEIPQGNIVVTTEGLLYQMASHEPSENAHEPTSNSTHPHAKKTRSLVKGQVVKVSFLHSHFPAKIDRENRMTGTFQYLKGKDQSKWVQGASAYQRLYFHEVYEGIDLALYFSEGRLKYDFLVHPGSNPKQILMQYDGADSLSIEDNHLVIHTSLGKVLEKPPYSYQVIEKLTREIDSRFRLQGNKVGFEFPKKYDASKLLVIDPLLFTTFSGSRADNWGNTATYDSAGNFYSGGIVFGDSAFPVTPGPFQAYGGGNTDVLLLKYSPDGVDLLFAAYLGGSDSEIPISMIVNNKNELVVLGVTGSFDFPVSATAFDRIFNGGVWTDAFYNFIGTPLESFRFSPEIELRRGTDIFVTIINTVANNLVASTFLGGRDNDGLILGSTPPIKNYGDQLRGEVMIDNDDNIYIASHTYSSVLDGITTPPTSGNLDALAIKFSPDLANIEWLHRNGGSGHEAGLGIRLDSKGDVFLAGGTNSPTLFPSSSSGLHSTLQGGMDGYILKLAGSNGTPINATYLGTSKFDQCYFIDIDYNDLVYVFGLTKGNYPISPKVYSNPNSGQFIHKLTNDLTTSIFSTVIGSGKRGADGEINPDISPTAFMVNNCRKIFLSGWGGEVNISSETYRFFDENGNRQTYVHQLGYSGGNLIGMPTTPGAFQTTTNGTGFYFMILHPEALSLAYATFFAGENNNREHVDGGTSRFDKRGIIYQSICAGCGGFSNLPTNTPAPPVWSSINNSENCNNGSIKFDLGQVIAEFETIDSLADIPSVYGCAPITFLLKNNSTGATNYKWEVGNGQIFEKNDSIFVKFTERGLQHLTLIAFDTSICRLVDTARAIINAGDVRVDFPKDRINCGVQPFTASLKLYTPWAKVEWQPTTGLSDPFSPTPVITPTGGEMTYVIRVTDDTLCIKTDTFRVTSRIFDPKAQFKVFDSLKLQEKYAFCFPSTGFFKSYATEYDTLWWEENKLPFNPGLDSFHYSFTQLGKTLYTISVRDTACKKTVSQEKVVTLSYPFVTYPSDIKVCPDSSALVSVVGDTTFQYTWSPTALFSNPHAMQQVIKPDSSGTIYILVTDSLGCQASGSFQYGKYILQEAIPDREGKICPKIVPGIHIQASELKEYNWLPMGYTSNPLYVTSPGKYYLIGKTMDGCPVKDSIVVIQRCDPEIHVPDAFTPDGDGRNDFFQVFGHEITTFDIKIFNRWGELIYHSSDFRFQWDGTYRNQTVPIGTYPYVITYSGVTFEGNKVSESLSGDVTVVK